MSLITLFFRFSTIRLSRNIKARCYKTIFCPKCCNGFVPNYIRHTRKRKCANGKGQSFAVISGKAESSGNISGLQERNATIYSVLFCWVWEHISPNYMFRTMWSRDCGVVLVRFTIDLGKSRGVGKLEWGGGGQFTSNLGPGWTGSHHARGGIPSK
jgi:hypothetical protein